MEIEKVALAKEKEDSAAKNRLEELNKELANLKEQQQKLQAIWKAEKEPIKRINNLKDEIESAKIQFTIAEREGNYAKASEIKYGTLAKLEKQVSEEQKKLKKLDTTFDQTAC